MLLFLPFSLFLLQLLVFLLAWNAHERCRIFLQLFFWTSDSFLHEEWLQRFDCFLRWHRAEMLARGKRLFRLGIQHFRSKSACHVALALISLAETDSTRRSRFESSRNCCVSRYIVSHHMISSALPARIHSGGNNIRQMSSECCSISSQSSWTCSTWKACSDGSHLASFMSHSLTTQFSNMSTFSASRIALVSTKDSPISQLRHGFSMFHAFKAFVTLQNVAHQSICLCTNLSDSRQPISMCRHSPCTTPVQVMLSATSSPSFANSPNKKYRFFEPCLLQWPSCARSEGRLF